MSKKKVGFQIYVVDKEQKMNLIEVLPTTTIPQLKDLVKIQTKKAPKDQLLLFHPKHAIDVIKLTSLEKTLQEYGIKAGDILHLVNPADYDSVDSEPQQKTTTPNKNWYIALHLIKITSMVDKSWTLSANGNSFPSEGQITLAKNETFSPSSPPSLFSQVVQKEDEPISILVQAKEVGTLQEIKVLTPFEVTNKEIELKSSSDIHVTVKLIVESI